jgi:hypothetical protein
MTAALPAYAAAPVLPRRRTGWLVAGVIFAVALIGFGALSLVSLLAHQSYDRHHVWTGNIATLDVSDGDGSVTIVGADRTGALVTATGDRGLHKPSDVETLSTGRLAISSSCPLGLTNAWCDLNYRVTLPAGTQVVVHTGDGAVRVSGMTGAVTLASSDGNVSVTGSRSRQVSASSSDGDVSLHLLAVPTEVDAHSGDGDVDVSVPNGPTLYEVSAHSGDGSASTRVRTTPAGANRISASSSDGDVTVAYGAG